LRLPAFGSQLSETCREDRPSVPFFDSHAHLADAAFDDDREAVIERARTADAVGIVAIGESLVAAARAAEIAGRHRGFVFFTAGIHPHDAASFDPARDPEEIRRFLAQGAVAVGECGLDYHYDHAPRPLQRRAFAAQLALARETSKPVVVHTRDAEDDTMAMVREAGLAGIRGVLHCFTGSHALAQAGLEAGWYISFSGIVTFKKWVDDDLLRLVPADRLLLESDAPYLAPVPDRGKRNEPAWVARTAERVAGARDASAAEVGELCIGNAQTFFGLPEVL
jgi:TatD DNase family protein